jgi:hypothetical protein
MKLFKSKKVEKTTKTELKSVDGKYCIYHHGVGVFKHGCGTLLCRECLWEWTKCPNCDKTIDRTRPSLSKRRMRGKTAAEPVQPKTARTVSTGPAPQVVSATRARPGQDSDASPLHPAPPVRRDGAAPEKPDIQDDSVTPVHPVTQIRKADVVSLAKMRRDDDAGTAPADSKPPKADASTQRKSETEQTEDGGEDVIDIYDDDIAQKKPRGHVPMYKKLRHATIEPRTEEEDREDEKDKKKWEVRTVPPVLSKRRDYESL